jgi:putative PIG3 family NAD(P)H quinone oxidoreductase
MRAIVITRPGSADVLELREREAPSPGQGEVRVRVRATAVNRADLLQRRGLYPAPADAPADVPGLEFAGEVDSLGPGAHDLKVGDRVFGLTGGGSYAEFITAPSRAVVAMPEGMSFVEAAAVPEAFITAFDALVLQGGLTAGEDVLIPAVGSGVGTAAAQLVRALGGRAIGTARTASKLDRAASEIGLEEGILVESGQFAESVRARTGGRGVDLVLELVGGAYLAEDVACAAPRARIVLVGLMAGTGAELDLGAVLRKRLMIRGTVLRSRPLEEKIAAAQSFARHVVPLLARRLVRPIVGGVLPLAEAKAAHELAETNDTFGKLVLTV